MNKRARSLLPVAAVAAALAAPPDARAAETAPAQALHALFDEAWAFALQEEPLFATAVGERRYDDRLASVSRAAIERRAAQTRTYQQRLATIDRAQLSPTDRVSYDMFAAALRDDLADYEFKAWLMPLNAEGSFHSGFARLPVEMPLASARDYENYLARLRAFPRYADEHVALLKEGLATGYTMPAVVLDGFDQTIRVHVVDAPEKSVFWRPFEAFPAAVPAADHARLREAGRAAIAEAILPSYRAFLDFMVGTYIPGCRKTIGASELPNGRAYYAQRVRYFTTLDVTPEQVHQIGLREVARIKAEMIEVLKQVGWQKDFPAFLDFLRTDPRFYAKTPEELLARAALIAKRMDGKLPSLFGRLPRQPYGIEPVPADIAPKYTGGRYSPAPIDSPRAGMYWVNTWNLPSRPFYTLEALTLHEAVPGHHLQMALTQELRDLPLFRRNAYINAFGEGWALYAERLGLEAGFYTDPYSNFGRLTYEMWRACRLVVDTGLHAFAWTRQQAIDYLASSTALSLHEVRTETDRYIGWPGQALAYKMGELKIRELRAKAEQALGPAFDLRAFHDAVLASGTVPLPVLEEQIQGFIEARKKEASR
jgi:uncharacterized protein (DUF885 family)